MNAIALYASVQSCDLDALVREHAPLVKRIAYHLLSRLPPSVQVDDLIQAGMIGLLESAQNFDAGQGASFETYAGIRIRGAMLDELRRYDWTPRSVHRKARDVAEAIRVIEARAGRDARDVEVAEALGMPLSDYHQVLQDTQSCRMFSVEELLEEGDGALESRANTGDAPDDRLTRAGFANALADAISSLPERERMVVSMYYDDELNLREIGEVLGVSESRVCQIQSQAMLRLRARMHDWMDEDSGSVKRRGRRKSDRN
jgi:RNA polymerase sigma factor for flagellar operon FliA